MPRFLYTLLLTLILPFVPLKLLWRGMKQREYLAHWGERFGFYATPVSQPVIWLHCVSVGETRAAAPLVKAIQAQYPNHQILLTHATPTGRATGEQLFGTSVQRVYLPYDVPFAVGRFLKHFQPKLGLILETELWFNLIAGCQQRQIPLLLLNARLSEKSANGYRKLGRLVTNGLNALSGIAAQTEDDAARLRALGAAHVQACGNLKFDVQAPEAVISKGYALRELLGVNRTVFLAASTRDGEEAIILEAVKGLDALTVIVPRHPQRFDEVAKLLEQQEVQYLRRSALEAPIAQNIEVVLGDSMGELFTYYAACDFAFIGGSLLPLGGQNLIEACMLAKPVLIGPHTFNFAEASKEALACGAAIQVSDAASLRARILALQHDRHQLKLMSEAASTFSRRFTGATQRMMALIEQSL